MNKILETMKAELEATKTRSAWERGVMAYAIEILETVEERSSYEGHTPADVEELKDYMLNGARDWSESSWGGSFLIYDGDIAERLCTPSELKRTRNGERRPNAREEWLDTQARALRQASNRVRSAFRHATANA
jgi:hypothetical protein